MIGIPLRKDLTFYDLQITLDGITYTLEIRWVPRGSSYYMNVLDEQGLVMLQAGLRIVCGAAMGARTADRSPPGFFVAVDTSGQGRDPGFGEFGDRVLLLYATKADLVALGL